MCRKCYTAVPWPLPIAEQLHHRMYQTDPEANEGRGESGDGHQRAQAWTNPLDASTITHFTLLLKVHLTDKLRGYLRARNSCMGSFKKLKVVEHWL